MSDASKHLRQYQYRNGSSHLTDAAIADIDALAARVAALEPEPLAETCAKLRARALDAEADLAAERKAHEETKWKLARAWKEAGIPDSGPATGCVPCRCGGFRAPGDPWCGRNGCMGGTLWDWTKELRDGLAALKAKAPPRTFKTRPVTAEDAEAWHAEYNKEQYRYSRDDEARSMRAVGFRIRT